MLTKHLRDPLRWLNYIRYQTDDTLIPIYFIIVHLYIFLLT